MGPHTNDVNETRQIMDNFRRIVRGIRHSSQQSHRYGLTSAQFFVLEQIGSQEGLSVNDIANLTFTHQSTVSEIIGRLVAKKFVSKTKSPQDQRKIVLSLTKKGQQALLSATRTPQEQLVKAILSLPTKKRSSFCKLLGEVVERANFANQTPSLFFEESKGN